MLGHREAALPRRPRDRWATDVLLVGVTAVGGGVLWTAPFLCIVYAHAALYLHTATGFRRKQGALISALAYRELKLSPERSSRSSSV